MADDLINIIRKFLYPRDGERPDDSLLLQKLDYTWMQNENDFRQTMGDHYDKHRECLYSWMEKRRNLLRIMTASRLPNPDLVYIRLLINDVQSRRLGPRSDNLLCKTFAVMTMLEEQEYLFKRGLELLNNGESWFLSEYQYHEREHNPDFDCIFNRTYLSLIEEAYQFLQPLPLSTRRELLHIAYQSTDIIFFGNRHLSYHELQMQVMTKLFCKVLQDRPWDDCNFKSQLARINDGPHAMAHILVTCPYTKYMELKQFAYDIVEQAPHLLNRRSVTLLFVLSILPRHEMVKRLEEKGYSTNVNTIWNQAKNCFKDQLGWEHTSREFHLLWNVAKELQQRVNEADSSISVSTKELADQLVEEKERRYLCQYCERQYKRLHDLKKHEKAHPGPWKCHEEKCKYFEKGFHSEIGRDNHMDDEHFNAAP